jgi:hypothetical protein
LIFQDIHIDLSKKIIEQPVTSIKSWVKINYQKHILNFKKTKDFEERFEEAQKNWSNLYHKMEKCEKEFKESIQTTLHCEQTSKSAESNPKYTSEQKYKLQEKAIKAKNDQAKAKEKYQESVIQLDLYRPRYVEQMQVEFKKTEHFEQERMLTFKQVLLKCHDLLEKQHSDDRFDDLYLELQKKINEINPSVDLEYWSNRFGPGTPQNWPVFIDHEKNIKQNS